MKKFFPTQSEVREPQHLLKSFSDSFGFIIVIIHPGVIDSPGSEICIIPCVCYIAVYSKGRACKNKFINITRKIYKNNQLNKHPLLLSPEYLFITKNPPWRSMLIYFIPSLDRNHRDKWPSRVSTVKRYTHAAECHQHLANVLQSIRDTNTSSGRRKLGKELQSLQSISHTLSPQVLISSKLSYNKKERGGAIRSILQIRTPKFRQISDLSPRSHIRERNET